MKKISIKTKLIGFVAVSNAALIVFFLFYAARLVVESKKESIQENLNKKTQASAQLIQKQTALHMKETTDLALDFIQSSAWNADSFFLKHPDMLALRVYDFIPGVKGKLTVAKDHIQLLRRAAIDFNELERSWAFLKKVIQKHDWKKQSELINFVSGEGYFSHVQTFYYVESAQKLFAAKFLYSEELLEELREKGSITLIADQRGRVVFHSHPEKLGTEYANNYKSLYEKVSDPKKTKGGLTHFFKSSDEGEEHLVAFRKLPQTNLLVLEHLPVQDSMLSIYLLIAKFVIGAFILIGVAGIAAYIFGIRITGPIEKLVAGTKRLVQGDYSSPIQVKRQDELGSLAFHFNEMMAQLSSYHREMEDKVVERTTELDRAMDLQSVMLDSLGQGFFMIDPKGTIQPSYSQACLRIFGKNFSRRKLSAILGLTLEESQKFQKFYPDIFNDSIEWDLIAPLLPSEMTSKKGQIIGLRYRREKLGPDQFLVVIGTDITNERQAMDKAKQEQETTFMIRTIVEQRDQFYSGLEEMKRSFNQIRSHVENYSTEDLQGPLAQQLKRSYLESLHGIKGIAGQFSLGDLGEQIHTLEEKYQAEELWDFSERDGLQEHLDDLDHIYEGVNAFLLDHKRLTLIESIDDTPPKLVKRSTIDSLLGEAFPKNSQRYNYWYTSILGTSFKDLMLPYQDLTVSLCHQQGKELESFEIEGEMLFPPETYNQLFQSFVHIFRNIVDHGIELPEERERKNKARGASVSVRLKESNQRITVIIEDDGQGIDPEKVYQKAKEKDLLRTEAPTEEEIIDLIFHPEFSTSETVSNLSGRGIGLSACRTAASELGGKISARARSGGGSSFTIEFPNPSTRTTVAKAS